MRPAGEACIGNCIQKSRHNRHTSLLFVSRSAQYRSLYPSFVFCFFVRLFLGITISFSLPCAIDNIEHWWLECFWFSERFRVRIPCNRFVHAHRLEEPDRWRSFFLFFRCPFIKLTWEFSWQFLPGPQISTNTAQWEDCVPGTSWSPSNCGRIRDIKTLQAAVSQRTCTEQSRVCVEPDFGIVYLSGYSCTFVTWYIINVVLTGYRLKWY